MPNPSVCVKSTHIEQENKNGSNTAKNCRKHGGRPFKNGVDPRRNLKGRPRTFEACREIAQAIANEPESNKRPAIENILRDWKHSPEPTLQKAFVEYAFGKVPDKIESDVNLKQKHVLHWPHERPDLVPSNDGRN